MKTISKFFILGGLSTIVDYSIYSILVFSNFNTYFAIIVGYAIGFIFNFYFGRKYVFTSGRKIITLKKEFLYVLYINIFAVILNILFVYLLLNLLSFDVYVSRAIAIIIVFFWNYFLRKIYVYK